MKISIVIPCYRSQNIISNVVDEIENELKNNLSKYEYEIILINDSSPDGTYAVIKEISRRNPYVKAIDLAKNFGQHNSIMAGLNRASGDIILCMDDDGQTDPKQMSKIIDALDQNTDVVYAKYEENKQNLLRNFGSEINNIMLVMLLGKPKGLYISSYFVMRKYVKDEIIKYKNPYPYLGGLILRSTHKIKNIIINHKNRKEGKSGYNFRKLLRLWVNGFTNFSVKPLRIATVFSIIIAIVSIIVIILLIINKILNPEVPMGWTSSIMSNLLICSVLSFFLGIIGEYVGRIYISINKLPQYVIRNDEDEGEDDE